MQANPGIVTFSAGRSASVQCSQCSAVVYELQPYEGVYPVRSAMRSMGTTKRVTGDCKSCGHKYEFPVTRPA
jgi:hypothetical protein